MRAPLPDLRRLPALVDTLTSALPRALALLDDAEALLRRVDALVDRIEETRQSADHVIVRTAGTVASVEPTIERAQRLLDASAPLLDRLVPVTERLLPTLDRLAETTDPDEIEALVGLVDHLPTIVEQLETDVLPIMATMGSVGPDIHAMLETMGDLAAMLERIPGLNRRRHDDD